jgi:hypothetical protein
VCATTFRIAHDEITALEATTAGAPFLRLAGGTMTGLLTRSGDPSGLLDAATKNYVDNALAGGSGGGGVPEAPVNANTYGRGNATWVPVLPLSGGTVTGAVNIRGNFQTNDISVGAPPGGPLGLGSINMLGPLVVSTPTPIRCRRCPSAPG